MYYSPYTVNRAKNLVQKSCLILIFMSFMGIKFGMAQTQRITLHVKDASLISIFEEIRNQTEFDFVYNHDALSKAATVSVNIDNATIDETLNLCLRNSNFTYKKVNNTIVVTAKEKKIESPQPTDFKQNIKGKIRDKDSKSPLIGATVLLMNVEPSTGTVSDADGNFVLKDLPVGRYTLLVSYIGYEDVLLSELQLGSGKELELSIEMFEQISSLQAIKVGGNTSKATNEMATVSARSFNVEETRRYAASINDPARMALVYSGVSGGDDASNEIIIRGNSPNWMMWRLEGIEIPSPNHFAEEGYSAGAVGILSTNVIGKSDFYTGAFPAEYGNALSGVFDIKMRNGNSDKREYSAQFGVLGLELSAEGPFQKGKKASYLLNYRYSTLSMLNDLNFEISENSLPNYQDLAFKLYLPTQKYGNFSFWSIGGKSDVDEKYYPDTTLGEKFYYGYTDYTETGMYAAGMTHFFMLDQTSYIKTVAAKTRNYSSETAQNMDSVGMLYGSFYDRLQNVAFRVNSYYNKKFNARLTARIGVIYNNLSYNYFQKTAEQGEDWKVQLNGKGGTNLWQEYVQLKYKINERATLTSGLNHTYFELNKDNSIEPRIGLLVKLKNKQLVGFGYGIHSKNENLPAYFVQKTGDDGNKYFPNKDLKLIRSTHYIASYQKQLGSDISVKIEAYLQNIDKLPVPLNPNHIFPAAFGGVNPNDTLVGKGKGRNYGIEFTLQKYFTKNYYFMVTSSWFESKYQPTNGIWYNSKYNINYVNNIVGGKEFKWKENRLLGLNAKVIWTGGKRQIPIDLPGSIAAGEEVYAEGASFSEKVQDYFRIDVGFKLHFYKSNSEHILSLDIQNTTNRLNTWFQNYDPVSKTLVDYPMAGLIPILNYRIEF